MAVHVLISHSGQHLAYENHTAGLDAFREWIEQDVGIPLNRQILMTPRGKNVKTLTADTEVFVYDKQNLSSNPDAPANQEEIIPDLAEATSAPTPDSAFEQWRKSVKNNRTWALESVERIKSGAEQTENLFYETDTIYRAILAALDNVKNGFASADLKFGETRQWALESVEEHQDALKGWERNYTRLSELPVREEVAAILRTSGDESRGQNISTLADLIELDSLRNTESTVAAASKDFQNQLDELQSRRDKLQEDIAAAENHIIQTPEPEVAALVEEAEALATRISRDYDDILKLQDDAKSLGQLTRKATNQFRDLLPGIQAIMSDLQQAFISTQDAKNAAVRGYFTALKEISGMQSRLGSFQSSVVGLDFREQDGLDELWRVFNLPAVFGCTLIEGTRRSEWTNKMQSEVDNVHSDLTQVTEEEQRRRKKWMSTYTDFLNKDLNSQDSLIDIKTSKPRNAWPFVEREEINAYLEDLRALGLDEASSTVLQRLKDLDAPAKRQKMRTFKNGSVHDLAASSNLGNGDARTLQDEKARLEERLKASESRVRKLEDLLHRQSQPVRPSSGLFTPGMSDYDRYSPSPSAFPKQSELPQRPSISLRKSSNNVPEEKVVAQRISSLEAQIQKLQSEAHEERRSSTENRDKMQEAQLVKQDLMANFEAQKQEFDEERQLMDDDNQKLKVRIEELEDELDRILGSREATKVTHDQKMLDLQSELGEVRDVLHDERQKSRMKVENLERDTAIQRERAANTDRQFQECRDERNAARNRNMELAAQLRQREEANADVISTLQNTHSNLSPAGSAPDDIGRLARALEILSEGAGIHARRLDDNLQLATAENKSLEEKVAHMETEAKTLTHKLASAELKASALAENLDQDRSKLKALRAELTSAHTDLDSLHTKLAAGETGSDTLREKLAEEEKKATELQELKYEQASTIQSLRNQLESIDDETKLARERAEKLKKKLEARGNKARQLSERLYQHNDRIIRMLEQFGFSIIRQDDSLVIQRASKVSASTIMSGNESSTPMKRTISGSISQQHYSDPSDLETLYWTSDTETTDEEAKYQSFLSALQRLDLDSTLEIVSKRYKDVENLAKKYQKDSRTYRERSHRLQSETHEKIAYRSFKEGDLALFLPTRNQATRPWAAFNVGAPHYFLREQDHHKLQTRDWLLARISRVEERVVDLSRSLSSTRGNAGGNASVHAEVGDSASARSFVDDENPFELSDGLRWYLIDAAEEKPGAPGTPSVGKSTVIASNVEAEASLSSRNNKDGSSKAMVGRATSNAAITKTLNRSLESRRSSGASKRSGSISLGNKKDRDGSSLKDGIAPLAPIVSGAEAGAGGSGVDGGEDGLQQQQQAMVKSTERTSREDAKVFDIRIPDDHKRHPSPTKSGQQQQQEQFYLPLQHHHQPNDYSPSPQSPPPLLARNRSQTQTPQKQRAGSPAKASDAVATPSPSKKGGWERLFNVEFNA